MNSQKTIFVSSKTDTKTKKFIYDLWHRVRVKAVNLKAQVKDSPLFADAKSGFVNFLFTGLIFTYVMWSFEILSPLRKGFGIAVSISVVQYYIKWYYSIRR